MSSTLIQLPINASTIRWEKVEHGLQFAFSAVGKLNEPLAKHAYITPASLAAGEVTCSNSLAAAASYCA